jgi:hypothetical protein
MGAIIGMITGNASSLMNHNFYTKQTPSTGDGNYSHKYQLAGEVAEKYNPYVPEDVSIPRHFTHMAGNFAGNVSWGTELVTTVQVTTAIPIYTYNYNKIFGRPSHASGVVGDFTGFAMFDVDDVEIVGATFSERLEITSFLRGGVYV